MSWRPRSPASGARLRAAHVCGRRTSAGGAARWQFQGRLVARELDAAHVAVRVPFDVRDVLLHQHPDVFSVPPRFAKHMIALPIWMPEKTAQWRTR